MKVLIAPDKFKGSLSALEVAQAIQKGIQQHNANIECVLHPLADGGDGSLEILQNYLNIEVLTAFVQDPLGRVTAAHYFISGKAAFIELASASGLVLLKESECNPLKTSTYGSGRLIADALERGIQEIYLFLGGSATNDGGIGIANALGFQFLDKNNTPLSPIGENLIHIHKIIPPPNQEALKEVRFYCLCDVKNPLCGPNGASHVYAAQKGASPSSIESLEGGMNHFANIVDMQFGKAIRSLAGGGAAGGIAAGLFGLLDAEIKSGIASILELSQFEQHIQTADLVISGEGKLDNQTLEGKVVSGVSDLVKKYQKPFVLFVGQHELEEAAQEQLGSSSIQAVLEHAKDLEDAMQNTAVILTDLAYRYFKKQPIIN